MADPASSLPIRFLTGATRSCRRGISTERRLWSGERAWTSDLLTPIARHEVLAVVRALDVPEHVVQRAVLDQHQHHVIKGV